MSEEEEEYLEWSKTYQAPESGGLTAGEFVGLLFWWVPVFAVAGVLHLLGLV